MISKEQVLERIEDLKQQREQMVANLHAVGGAIQDAEWFLQALGEEEEGKKDGE